MPSAEQVSCYAEGAELNQKQIFDKQKNFRNKVGCMKIQPRAVI